jgi:hypothetical protein
MLDPMETAIAPDEIRDVLAAAADVLFSDGISAALLDQWRNLFVVAYAVDDGTIS